MGYEWPKARNYKKNWKRKLKFILSLHNKDDSRFKFYTSLMIFFLLDTTQNDIRYQILYKVHYQLPYYFQTRFIFIDCLFIYLNALNFHLVVFL
jgi:hypothetical protein